MIKTDWEIHKLKGCVKEMRSAKYATDNNGTIQRDRSSRRILSFYNDGRILTAKIITSYGLYDGNYRYLYDDEGDCIERVNLNEKEEISSKTTYRYDFQHRVIEEFRIQPNGYVFSRKLYQYDDKENSKTELEISGSGKITKRSVDIYDKAGRIIDERVYDKDNICTAVYLIKFGENDSKVSFWHDGHMNLTKKCHLINDEHGNLIENREENMDGSKGLHVWYKNSYNDQNRLTSHSCYDEKDGLNWTHAIEYDTIGNILKEYNYKAISRPNGRKEEILELVTEFEYDYYSIIPSVRKDNPHESGA